MGYSSTEAERRAAGDWLNELVTATRQVQEAMRETPASGVLKLDTSRDLNAAPRLAGLHQAVATDHLVSFSGLLKLPGSHGPSLAAIDRSFLETWARALWVMNAQTSTRAEYRARAMVVAELKAAESRGIRLLSSEPIGAAIARATRERDEIKVMAPEVVPRPTALVKELLQQSGSPAEEAAAIYSHLSGVAHGESVFTASLIDLPIAPPIPQVALPSDNLRKYCATLFGVTVIATSHLTRAWGLPEAVGSSFVQAAEDLGSRLPAALG